MATCVGCSQEIELTASFCPRCGTPNPEAPTMATPTGTGRAETVPPDELKIRLQKALGRDFVVGDLVGEGGFAVVFQAQDRKLSRRVAVKVLRPELTASKSSVQRFVREAESAASLSHPHILPIFFVGEGEGLVYFGMPYVEGETLDARMARERQLPEAEVVRIGADVADALAEAHQAGLVHRDVKPANVLLQGARGRVLVADFGIAKAGGGSGAKLTGTGSIIGSPHYMSPEQAAGSGEVDHRSDIYSLGVVLWQMLAGELPFDAPDTQGILLQHLTQPLPALKVKRKGVSAPLVAVVARCCEKKAGDRFQSAAEVAEALRAAAAGVAPEPRHRRSRRSLIAAALAVVALGGVAAWQLAGGAGADEDAPAAAGETAPRPTSPVLAVPPFEVASGADSAGLARQMARVLTDNIASGFQVATVDFNDLIGRWSQARLSSAAPVESVMTFAYRSGANQVVLGSRVDAGRQVRFSADVYSTTTRERLGHAEVTGVEDSVFPMMIQLARQVAVMLCAQPGFNPANLCFDRPARPTGPVVVTVSGDVPAGPQLFDVLVSAAGAYLDARPRHVDAGLVPQGLAALQGARYAPASRGRQAVDAWSEVALTVRAAAMPAPADTSSASIDCASQEGSLRNQDRACYDSRPVPRTAPRIPVPTVCRATPSAATVLVEVSAAGDVVGQPALQRRSGCPAFDQAAMALVMDVAFAPARKAGTSVPAWVVVQVTPSEARPG